MKKVIRSVRVKKPYPIKLNLKMRITTLLFLVSLFQLQATESYSQKTKVTLHYKNVVLEEVLNKIESITDFKFIYKDNHINYTKKVSIKSAKEPLSSVLKRLFSNTQISFSVKGKQIILKPAKNKTSTEDTIQQQTKITGKVTDINKEPLPGASILIKGTTKGTETDFNGNFSIDVTNDNVILIVSYIGYTSKEIAIKGQNNLKIILEENLQSLNEVIIRGYRKSLSKAIDIKKNTVNSVDAVVAEDIAKFPQSNMSEAIQRISGIQIRRDNAGGVGNEVSVRGLPPEYTQVTLNGQAAPNSSEASRTYNFNTIPAELFGAVEVFKSPTAKLDEGGIGGTVNLKTRKALDIKDKILVTSLEGLYNTQGDKITPKASLVYGKNWNNKFGIIVGITYNRFLNASEGYDIVRYRDQSFDTNNDGTDDITDVRVPLPRYVHQNQDVKRFAFNFGSQYRPSDNFTLTFDALYSKNKQLETRYTPIFFVQGTEAINVKNDGPLLLSADFQDVRIVLENQQQLNDTDVFQSGLTGKWFMGNDWQLETTVSYGTNSRFIDRPRYYAQNINTVSFSIEDDKKWFNLQTPTDLTNPSQFTVTEARARNLNLSDKVFGTQADFTKIINNLKLEFGAKFTNRNKERTFFDNRIRGLSDDFAPISKLFTGFLDNVDEAKGPEEFLVPDWDKARDIYASQIDLKNAERKDAFFDITENVTASYIMGTFDWTKIKLNAGIRFVNTSIISRGLELDETSGNFSNREVKSSYVDVLPSINANYEIGKDLFVRANYARVMTRPNLSDLTSYREIDDVNLTISEKNPNLKPFRANQYEIGLEWYPKKETLVSGAVFVKDIESFITNETTQVELDGQTYTLRRPVNGNQASIVGMELNYQQPFSFLPSPFDGLGVVANYTLSNSNFKEVIDLGTGETESYDLPNNSKHSFNLIGYYEKYDFNFRVAYNYRSDFLRSKPVPEDGLKFRDDYGQTDISAGYDISDKFGITLNILNAFNARRFEYIFNPNFQDNISVFGTTWQLGARYSF
ncbi:TonB-dependent receptor [Polaribacter batillariae]|uniref:TonB-dependent receptor n=1 Tax=Polaribacter batillariae TaxID=2808900 RepID=A0ABX7SYJ3_9FLAO|nr:TonB-dependent receptor [Polaribacter batillariae]QTD38586.1 TonB-dependent receptor [Polaribacter batillariae]